MQDISESLKSIRAIDPDHIKNQLERLQKIKTPDESVLQGIKDLEIRQKLREDQLNKVKQLLRQNEKAMTQLDKTTIAIAEMDTVKGQADVDMETAMAELSNITERAKEYSI